MRTMVAVTSILLFAVAGCATQQASAEPSLGDVTQAKLQVYKKLLTKELPLLPEGWEQEYSAIFLAGDAVEQKIFVREFQRRNYRVKDISLRVPGIYVGDSDASTGQRALFFSATLIHKDHRTMQFRIRCPSCTGEIIYTVTRAGDDWDVSDINVKHGPVIP